MALDPDLVREVGLGSTSTSAGADVEGATNVETCVSPAPSGRFVPYWSQVTPTPSATPTPSKPIAVANVDWVLCLSRLES